MATSFLNAVANGVGATEAIVFEATNTKAIVIGCNVANKTGGILPISLILRTASGDSYVVKNQRVGNGENSEIMRGNKLVLTNGDKLVAVSVEQNSFDVIASILIGVA